MCYCWNFDDKGNVTGMTTDIGEIARRIDDSEYMPELKALRRKMYEEKRVRKQFEWDALPTEKKEEILKEREESHRRAQQEWAKFTERNKS